MGEGEGGPQDIIQVVVIIMLAVSRWNMCMASIVIVLLID